MQRRRFGRGHYYPLKKELEQPYRRARFDEDMASVDHQRRAHFVIPVEGGSTVFYQEIEVYVLFVSIRVGVRQPTRCHFGGEGVGVDGAVSDAQHFPDPGVELLLFETGG